MQLDRVVNSLGRHLRARYGERVHKLALHAGFTCPNRDGTLGRGGCAFCSVRSFSAEPEAPISAQLEQGRARIGRARRYLAYFQSYTNTYAEIDRLRALYAEALAGADVVGLCVGTRPDCVPDAVLDLLAEIREQGREVWLELGLQSAFDATLERVRRGHGFAAYADAATRARERGIAVCAHLIVGLPGERAEDSLVSAERALEAGADGLKLHPLMIVRGAALAAAHARGEVATLSLDAYAEVASELIRRTPAPIVFHRVCGTARPQTLIAPQWCARHLSAINRIAAELRARGGQGSLTANPYVA